jgi:ankyrin repeat protein
VISYLVRHNANIHALDSFGQTPLDVCRTLEMRELVTAIFLHHERGDPEPMNLLDTSLPPVSQQVVFDDHDDYLAFIENLRDFVESLDPVGKGIVVRPPAVAEPIIPSEKREGISSLFDEIKEEFEQNHTSISSFTSNLKAGSHTPPRRPSMVSISNDDDAPARSFSLSLSVEPMESLSLEEHLPTSTHMDPAGALPQNGVMATASVMVVPEDLSTVKLNDHLTSLEPILEISRDPELPEFLDIADSIADHSQLQPPEIIQPSPTSHHSKSDDFPTTATAPLVSKPKPTQHEILEQLADPMPSDGVQSLLWSICKRNGDVTALRTLLHSHPEALHVRIRDSKGKTPLHCALAAGYGDVVQFLLEKGTYSSIPDSLGNHPIHLACSSGLPEMVALFFLQDSRSCLKLVDGERRTPLQLAISQGHLPIVRILVEKDLGQLDTVDHHGHTPIELAKLSQQEDIASYLNDIMTTIAAAAQETANGTNRFLETDRDEVDETLGVDEQNEDPLTENLIVYHEGDCFLGLTDQPQYVEQLDEDEDDEENEEDGEEEGGGIEELKDVQLNVSEITEENLESDDSLIRTQLPEDEVEVTVAPTEDGLSDTLSISFPADKDPVRTSPSEMRKAMSVIEICNGVIFEETFEDETEMDDPSVVVESLVIPEIDVVCQWTQTDDSEGTQHPSCESTQTQTEIDGDLTQVSQLTQTDDLDPETTTQSIQTDEDLELRLTRLTPKWIPFLLSAGRLVSMREGSSLAKRFLTWKTHYFQSLQLRPQQLSLSQMLNLMRRFGNTTQRFLAWTQVSNAFQLWKSLPAKALPEITAATAAAPETPLSQERESANELESTPFSTPYHALHHAISDSDATPLLDGLSPLVSASSPMTPHSNRHHHIAQRLRFNDIVEVSAIESIPEEPEEDLTILGPLPPETLSLFKANEVYILPPPPTPPLALALSPLSSTASVSCPSSSSLCPCRCLGSMCCGRC